MVLKTSLAVASLGLAMVCCILSPQDSRPAAWYLQSNVIVEGILGQHLDVDSFFQLAADSMHGSQTICCVS